MATTKGSRQLDVALLINRSALKREPTKQSLNWLAPESVPAAIHQTLVECGFNVTVIVAASDCMSMIRRIRLCSPDVIFNLTREYRGEPRRASQLVAVLNILNIPFIGSGPQGILRAYDKVLSRTLAGLIGVRVSRFISAERGKRTDFTQLRYPVLVRSRFECGLGDPPYRSIACDAESLRALVRNNLRKKGEALVCEELIGGRQVSVGVAGNERIHVFPAGEPILSVPADGESQSRRAINRSRPIAISEVRWKRSNLSPCVVRRLQKDAKTVYLELQLRDFARIDFYLLPSGELYFLDANSRPDCSPTDFGMFAAWQSIGFAEFVKGIIACSIKRHQRETGALRRSTAAKLPSLIAGLRRIQGLIT